MTASRSPVQLIWNQSGDDEPFMNPLSSPYTGSQMIQVPMNEEQFAAAVTRLRANGIELSGNSGTLTKDGITAHYEYADSLLKVEITDRPMLLPLSLIEGRLKSYLEDSLKARD